MELPEAEEFGLEFECGKVRVYVLYDIDGSGRKLVQVKLFIGRLGYSKTATCSKKGDRFDPKIGKKICLERLLGGNMAVKGSDGKNHRVKFEGQIPKDKLGKQERRVIWGIVCREFHRPRTEKRVAVMLTKSERILAARALQVLALKGIEVVACDKVIRIIAPPEKRPEVSDAQMVNGMPAQQDDDAAAR